MGDRVAIFEPGGRLAQYGTPAELLGHPADDFVADFVGSTTGLRRLTVTADRPGAPRAARRRAPPATSAATVDVGATLEEALAAILRDDKAGRRRHRRRPVPRRAHAQRHPPGAARLTCGCPLSRDGQTSYSVGRELRRVSVGVSRRSGGRCRRRARRW